MLTEMPETFALCTIQAIINQVLTETFGCVTILRSPVLSLAKRLISQGKELMDIVPLKMAGYVYLVWAIGTPRYKIGRSVDPSRRIEELNKQSCYPLKLVEQFYFDDCIYHEKRAHRILDKYRVHGEWFELPKGLLETIDLWLKDPSCQSVQLTATRKIALAMRSPGHRATTKKETSTTCLRFETLGITLAKHQYLPPFVKIPEDFESVVKVCVMLKLLGQNPRNSWNWKTAKELKELIGGLPINQEQAKEWRQIFGKVKGHHKKAQKAIKMAAAENAISAIGGSEA